MSGSVVITCAFRRTVHGLRFMPKLGTPDDHPRWCELRASVQAADDDAGAAITAIEMRSWGNDFATDSTSYDGLRLSDWRQLDNGAFSSAHDFLHMNYGADLEDAAGGLARDAEAPG